MVYNKNIDELAAAMEAVLNDDSYRSVFERPRIKMASAEEPVETKENKNTVETAYEQLVEASRILDDLGLIKSSELALEAVYTLLSEAAQCCKSDCEKCTKDDDCECKCAEDSAEADDKKGKPEKGKVPEQFKKKEESSDVKHDDPKGEPPKGQKAEKQPAKGSEAKPA
jgi:hypothetical protein